MGYVVLAGPASLRADEAAELPPTMIRIGKDEIPEGYAASLLSPVTAAWKYMRAPHTARIKLTPLETAGTLGQVVDFLSIESNITRDGASVTKARYSVKNARGQYLVLKLPEGAKLWGVNKVLDDGGSVEGIPSQFDKGMLLVPVERPRDPNTATTVEIQYAVDNAASPTRQTLGAPVLVDAPVTFAEWRLTAGDKLAVRRASGNLSPDPNGGGHRFTRTSIMPGDAPLALTFSVVPIWLARMNITGAIACGALTILFAMRFILRRGRLGLACALVAAGATAVNLGVVSIEIAALSGVAQALFLFACGMLRLAIRAMCAVSARFRNRASAAGAGVEPPPLVEAKPQPDASHEGSARYGLAIALGLFAGAALALPAALDHGGELHGATASVTVWRDDIAVEVVPPEKDLREGATMRVMREIDCTFGQPGAYAYPHFADGAREDAVILHAAMPAGIHLGYARVAEEGDGDFRAYPALDLQPDGDLMFFVEKAGRYTLRFATASTKPGNLLKTKTFAAVQSSVTVTRCRRASWRPFPCASTGWPPRFATTARRCTRAIWPRAKTRLKFGSRRGVAT